MINFLSLQSLPSGAPFRYEGRNFYKGDPLPEPPYPFKRKKYSFRVYEVKNRRLDYENVYTLPEETEVQPL